MSNFLRRLMNFLSGAAVPIQPSHVQPLITSGGAAPSSQAEAVVPRGEGLRLQIAAPAYTEWRPIDLFRQNDGERREPLAVLILNQPVENEEILKLLWEKGKVIANTM